MSIEDVVLAMLILVAALLYSSVGHGGASGYLAAMAMMGIPIEVMRPTALLLNVLVAAIALLKYARVDAFSWRLFTPLALTSIPSAYLGGTLMLPVYLYKPLIGAVLILSAMQIYRRATQVSGILAKPPAMTFLLAVGGVLGFLSGVTGIGGGIFLSPLFLYFRWAEIKVIAGVAAAFILVNSLAGLLGIGIVKLLIPSALPYWACAALLGAWLGAGYGSQRLSNVTLKKLLSLVLLIAGIKMLLIGLTAI